MYCVYKHTSPNGKCYIGITKQLPEKRWQGGLGYRTQERFYRAIKKYGWDNFTHEILYTNLSLEQAEEAEKRLISEFRSTDKNHGYNVECGGNVNKGMSDETRSKLSVILRSGECNAKIRESNFRRWSDPEARKRMSEMFSGERNPMFGKKLSEAHRKAFVEAGRNAERIPRRGEQASFYGKHHTDESKRKISESHIGVKNGRAKRVLCIELNKEFGSVKDAYRETGIHFSSISKCCCGVNPRAGGYHWKYVEGRV